MTTINMEVVEKVVKDMATYRPQLTRERIIEIIKGCLTSDQTKPHLWPETTQDVWWGYQRHLKGNHPKMTP